MRENPAQQRSYQLAVAVVKLCSSSECRRFSRIRDQLLDCGTSVGAQVEEAIGAESKRDFLHKMRCGFKEARETRYRLSLIRDCGLLPAPALSQILGLSEECVRLLGSIVSSTAAGLREEEARRKKTG